MRHQTQGCLIRLGLAVILFGLVFLALTIYSNSLDRQAMEKYPPVSFITIDGTRLHYQMAGAGKPVVFIGGRNSKLQDFTLSPLFPPLTNRYQAIFIERPGTGYSTALENQPPTPTVQAHLIKQLLDQLGIDRPVVVGQSWGGVIALQFALSYPDSLSGIVLLGSAPYPKHNPPDPLFSKVEAILRTPFLGDLFLPFYVPVSRAMAASYLQENVVYMAPLTQMPASYVDTTIQITLRADNIKADAVEQTLVPEALSDVSSRLGEISIPVTIVAGSLDTAAIDQSAQLVRDLPDAEVLAVPGAHHYLWYAYPEIVIRALDQTWQRSTKTVSLSTSEN